jgi:NAD(P)H dehydrogenase (quinone)
MARLILRTLACILLASAAALAASPVRILIAYHSRTGNTEKMAAAVREGAASIAGVEVVLRKIADITNDDVVKSDRIIFGTPVEWGSLSAESKGFLDRVGEALGKAGPTLGEGRTAAVFCTAGSPSNGQEMARMSAIAALLAMRFVIVGGVNEDGFGTLGAQAATAGRQPGINDRDRADARRLGERFARITRQLRAVR